MNLSRFFESDIIYQEVQTMLQRRWWLDHYRLVLGIIGFSLFLFQPELTMLAIIIIAMLAILFLKCLLKCYEDNYKWKSMTEFPNRIKAVAVHSQKPWILMSFYSGKVVISKNNNDDEQTTSVEFCVSPDHSPVRACQFIEKKNNDEDWIVAASDDGRICVFRVNDNGNKLYDFQAHDDYIRSLAVHPTRPWCLSSSDDMTVKLWDIEYNFACTRIFQGHMHYVMQIKINPNDTSTFATASLDGTIKLWNLEDNESSTPLGSLEGHEKGVNCIDYYYCSSSSSDDDENEKLPPLLASGSDDHMIHIWNYKTRQLLHILTGHFDNVSAVLFHPNLPVLVSTSEDGTVRLWRTHNNFCQTTLLGEEHGNDLNRDNGSENDNNDVDNHDVNVNKQGRGWALAGSFNKIAVGFDNGCVSLDLVTRRCIKSDDVNGKDIEDFFFKSQCVLEHDHIIPSSTVL